MYMPNLFPGWANRTLGIFASFPDLAELDPPSTQDVITHLPHKLAFSVHTQVELRLLALDPDLTPEGVCLH